MGDWADGILNGDFDEVTGEYIGPGDGYPRSFYNAKKNTGHASIQTSTKTVIDHFKNDSLSFQELEGGGLNIKIAGNGTITVWWRKGKWTHSKKGSMWFYFRNAPKEHANELIARIEGIMGIGVTDDKKVAPASPKAIERELKTSGFLTPEETLDWHIQDASDNFDANYREDCIEAIKAYHQQFSTGIIEIPADKKLKNNVQQCIDHLLKKAETIGNAKGADHKSATLLKMTAQELIQYL